MKGKKEFGDKPYNRCLLCPHRTVRCDGPRTSAMELARWREFMRDMKDINDLTNAEIAKRAGMSTKRVEQIMSTKSSKDIYRDTARRIEDAIIGSSNQYPCYLAFEEGAPENLKKYDEVSKELERTRKDLENIHTSYNAELQTIRGEAQRKIDFLLAQLEHLREENAYLRKDNERRGAIIDKYVQSISTKEKTHCD